MPQILMRSLSVRLVAVALLVSGCRTNELAKYHSRIETAEVALVLSVAPSVYVGTSRARNPLVRSLTNVTAGITAATLANRVANVVDNERIEGTIYWTFVDDASRSLPYRFVESPERGNTRIDISIQRFGLSTYGSAESPLHFVFDARVEMIYLPENRLIWEFLASVNEPAAPYLLGAGGGFAQAGANLATIGGLTDEQLQATFEALAAEAGRRVAMQMRTDSVIR